MGTPTLNTAAKPCGRCLLYLLHSKQASASASILFSFVVVRDNLKPKRIGKRCLWCLWYSDVARGKSRPLSTRVLSQGAPLLAFPVPLPSLQRMRTPHHG